MQYFLQVGAKVIDPFRFCLSGAGFAAEKENRHPFDHSDRGDTFFRSSFAEQRADIQILHPVDLGRAGYGAVYRGLVFRSPRF